MLQPFALLIIYFLYLMRRTIIIMFNNKEKELVMMMGKSSRKIPYTTQVATPVIKTKSIHFEISSAFFSRMVLKSCGRREDDVQIPANKPTI